MLNKLMNKLQLNKDRKDEPDKVKGVRRSMQMQALLAGGAILLVLVMVFAMTTAWYTNVAKTSSLSFDAAAWGFDSEKIIIAENTISIAPGTSGIVPLSVDNSEQPDWLRIGVAVSKNVSDMPEEMKQRIYFYADTSKTVTFEDGASAETVSKVYLGATGADSYMYGIQGGDILRISEEYCSDVPLKWEWVYDMQGYYFRGIVSGNTVTVDEYLRPIQYDLEDAVFDTNIEDENYTGELISVGNKTKEAFLEEFSSADGYKGTIKAENAVTVSADSKRHIYYKVETDQSGYGVWAYLCNYGEILNGIDYDNKYAQGQINANIIITAESVPASVQVVGTETELKEALENGSADVVELSSDITLTQIPVLLQKDANTILDLNGFGIFFEDAAQDKYIMIRGEDGADLTILNGTITGNGTVSNTLGAVNNCAVYIANSNATLSHVTVSGVDGAVYVSDRSSARGDSAVKIEECEFTTEQAAVTVEGNGSATEGKTHLVIQNSTITSLNHVAIGGQGANSATDQRWGTDVVILDSTVKGFYAAYYQPQQKSEAVIYNSTMEGYCGIVVKGGTVLVKNCKVTGTGKYNAAKAAASGWTDTGDGVYIEAGYDWPATVILKGENEVISEDSYAVQLCGQDGKGPGKILIYDGVYTGRLGAANWDGKGIFEIYNGSFSGSVEERIKRYDQ